MGRRARCEWDQKDLRAAPGILIRRVHQIYLAIYAQKCAEFGTTPVQSSIMQILLKQPGIDQVALAGEIGIARRETVVAEKGAGHLRQGLGNGNRKLRGGRFRELP